MALFFPGMWDNWSHSLKLAERFECHFYEVGVVRALEIIIAMIQDYLKYYQQEQLSLEMLNSISN